MEPIVLASGSLRRQDFFRLLGLPFSIMPSRADETLPGGLPPERQAEGIAVRKVEAILASIGQGAPPWIFGADTLIVMDDEAFGKPGTIEEARAMLKKLSGRDHRVVTGMALYNNRTKRISGRSVSSVVRFAELDDFEIEWYLETGEWQGVAGAYRIQGLAACFVSRIEGSFSSIVGLPLREFYEILRQNGYRYGGLPPS